MKHVTLSLVSRAFFGLTVLASLALPNSILAGEDQLTSRSMAAQASRYFDANWAAFASNQQNRRSATTVSEIANNYFDANWAAFASNQQNRRSAPPGSAVWRIILKSSH